MNARVHAKKGEPKLPPLRKNGYPVPPPTQEKINKILETLKQGIWMRIASCKAAGIAYDTFLVWLNKYPEFCEAVKKAEQMGRDAEVERCVNHIRNNTAWQSKAWILERILPEIFGLRTKIDETIEIKSIAKLTDDQLKRIIYERKK